MKPGRGTERGPSTRGTAQAVCCLVLVTGCVAGGPKSANELPTAAESVYKIAPTEPLGLRGPTEARETRVWTTEAMEQVPRWTIADLPTATVVLGSVQLADGPLVQMNVISGSMFGNGRVLLLVHYPTGPHQVVATTSTLEPFRLSPSDGQDAMPVAGEHFGARKWVHGHGVLIGDEVVVAGNPPGNARYKEVVYLDSQSRLTRPPARIEGPPGRVLGAFRDGSVLFWAPRYRFAATDTLVTISILSARPIPESGGASGSAAPREFLTFATPRQMGISFPRPRSPHYLPLLRFGVNGDTVWTVPTDRPELLAVHRSGEILLRVKWESGDRSLPVELRGAHDWGGLERFPAVSKLLIGTDGLVYVQLWAVRNGRLTNGREWLVFDTTGELVSRVETPRGFHVTAFGKGSVLGTGRNAAGANDVRIYRIETSQVDGLHED